MASDTIIVLPGEIIVYILEDKRLSLADIVHFGLTCKSLYKIVNGSNKLWKTKFFKRWPLLKEVYETNKKLEHRMINWKEEMKVSVTSRTKLLCYLFSMSSKHHRKQDLPNSEFKDLDPLFCPKEGAHPLAYYFLLDELDSLIKHPTTNLTHRYYGLKIIRYLKQTHLKDEWQKFISLPSKQQTLERGATFVAQWSQPEKNVSYLAISSILDNIAEQTKEFLREQYPGHSIFSVSNERFNFWKNNIIDDNQWNVTETRQITDALCEVLFVKLKFYGNSKMYYWLEKSFIDHVLETGSGIPITLAIVFESVARRLGVHCEPVNFPSHFLLRWKERYGPGFKDTENFYIDVFNHGHFVTKESCPRVGGVSRCPIEKYNVHEAATAIEVVTRIANNLEVAARQHTHINDRTARLRSVLELRYMIQPDANIILQLGRIYISQYMDLTELVKILENMQQDLELISRGQANIILQTFQTLQRCQKKLQPEEEVKPKRRVPSVKYAIGLIMTHRIHGYFCVITGWDPRCMASTEWMNEMNVDELDQGANQPFYNIFVDDGSCHYVAQENLVLSPNSQGINHHAIGRYFYKFSGAHYIPNEEKAREYPEDERFCNELLVTYMQNRMAYNTT
ncbi:F-box only protein 21-like [Frieseomelitta varia]|uniref:F-box only protein 21-like n=1 Tax=Frieseomelitta varia TaxID=561572 RepID=UPI001CB6798B|nr:F-box only protein 21-like [Frieseomelitta varia]